MERLVEIERSAQRLGHLVEGGQAGMFFCGGAERFGFGH